MAVVTPVVPPTRRNVELVLLSRDRRRRGRLRHRRASAVQGAVPQD